MNLLQRIGNTFKAVRPAALTLPLWQDGQPHYERATFENFVTHGLRKNELIFACIDADAVTAASVRFAVYGKDDEEMPDHPLRQLLSHPNPHMTEYEFLALTRMFLKLAGKAYFEKVRDGAGNLVALYPLRPDYVQIIPDRETWIKAYRYSVPGAFEIDLMPDQVLAIRSIDPLDMYSSIVPVGVAARVGDVDNSTTDFIKLFFERGTMPPGILTSKQKLTDADVGNIKRRWAERYGGFNKWFEPAVLDVDASYQRLGATFSEMQFEQLDRRNEARICAALRVPPIIIGAMLGLESATYSNYEQARKAWWEDVLVPSYKRLSDAFTNQLAVDFGADVVVRADLSESPALRENEDAKWTRANAALAGGWITVNEARQLVNLENLGGAGDVFLRTFGAQVVPVNAMPDQITQVPPPTLQGEPNAVDEEAALKWTLPDIEKARRVLEADFGFTFDEVRHG